MQVRADAGDELIAWTVIAVGISALTFAAAHAPAMVFMFGAWQEVPLVSWLWLVALNGLLGVTFGVIYLRSAGSSLV